MNRRPDSTPRPPDEQAQVCENVNTLADQFNSTRIHRTGLKYYQADRSEESLKIGEIRSLEELRNLQLGARRLGNSHVDRSRDHKRYTRRKFWKLLRGAKRKLFTLRVG